jgi:hypothetical protein
MGALTRPAGGPVRCFAPAGAVRRGAPGGCGAPRGMDGAAVRRSSRAARDAAPTQAGAAPSSALVRSSVAARRECGIGTRSGSTDGLGGGA